MRKLLFQDFIPILVARIHWQFQTSWRKKIRWVRSAFGTETSLTLGARRAAQRKLDHELGTSCFLIQGIPPHEVPLDQLHFLTRIHYLAPSDGLWGEHEIDYIFIFQGKQVSLDNINSNEVKSIRWVSQAELKQLFEESGRNQYFDRSF